MLVEYVNIVVVVWWLICSLEAQARRLQLAGEVVHDRQR